MRYRNPKSCSVRDRSQTSGSNGLSSARAATLRGSRASRCRYDGLALPSTATGTSSPSSTSEATAAFDSAGFIR
jgi:hypothetical protein